MAPEQRLDHVGSPALKRCTTGMTPLAVLSLLLVVALSMMVAATQNSSVFGRVYLPLLVINVTGIVTLLALILFNLHRLVVQFRAGAMGSRLTLRVLGFFIVLTVVPVSVVYIFSVEAVSKGVDNWFDVKIERALNDALALGHASLDAIKQDLTQKSRDMAFELKAIPDAAVGPALKNMRDRNSASQVTLFSDNGRIIASSGRQPETGAPTFDRPSQALFASVRNGTPFSDIDPLPGGGFQLRVLVPVYAHQVGAPLRILQVVQQLPDRYSKLGGRVQAAFAEYEKLIYLRRPLKFGLIVTLSLVASLTLLIAVWAAIFSARRLVTPLSDLAEGTRAVARGNYNKRLPIPASDELGVLVKSFNDMTRKILQAQNQITRSQRETEVERTYLETVLTHLSSGVLSFDARQRLRTHNTSAGQVLGVDLKRGEGRTLRWLANSQPQLASFVQAIEAATTNNRAEWHAEVVLQGYAGRRVLILRGTMLPGPGSKRGGHVVVFDDITALIQAQRDAAWAEVARRLAHEIKNPLTPIQLSAERIRNKCMEALPAAQRETLDRATRIIAQQVESMKTMVNNFSDYARPARMQPEPVDLSRLVRDVAELYRGRPNPVTVNLDLESGLSPVIADPGRLRQVLHNLLLNSHDALAGVRDPRIDVRTRLDRHDGQDFTEITISDNGPGFASSVRDRLFEPYVTTKEKGTGLGLAIVKKIVEEHSGALSAESVEGQGARITVRLPVLELSSTLASPPAERSA
ncbi:MAG: ATP-binding protein [Acidiferrobacterales bacterium]